MVDAALMAIIDAVHEAARDGRPLRIVGGATKDHYGGPLRGKLLDLHDVSGVSRYEPTELVVTVRAGTRLSELDAVLAERNQWLPFEPPRFGPDATVGGMVAAGLAGPARATAGPVRDHVLGVTMVDGRGAVLTFGGQVMKNVAGYDISRLMVGAMGVLGVIAEVSLKVMPRPPASVTLRLPATQDNALRRMNAWAGQPLPLSATCWQAGAMWVRLSGAQAAVRAARDQLGGDALNEAEADAHWASLRDQHHAYFVAAQRAVDDDAAAQAAAARSGAAALAVRRGPASMALWRLALPSTAAPFALPSDTLIEWGGAQRWLLTDAAPVTVRQLAAQAGGHATLYRAADKSGGAFAPLPAALARIHQRLKHAFDPHGLFNPGRLYPEF